MEKKMMGAVLALMVMMGMAQTAVAQTLGKRDIVFGTDLKAATVVQKAKTLAKRLAKPNSAGWQARGDQRRTYYFTDAGTDMPYRVCVPDSWDGVSPMTMVMFLHGGWNDESSYLDQNDKQMVRLANQYGVLLVSPMGYNEGYGNFLRLPATFGNEEEMNKILDGLTAQRIADSKLSEQDVINVIELVLAEYPVNRSAMYLMGHSMGSGGTWYIGGKYADYYWHGLLPISGPFVSRQGYPWERLRNKPIFMTEGLQAGASLGGSRTLYNYAHDVFHLDITYKEVNGDHGGMVPMVLEDCFKFITNPSISFTEPTTEVQHLFYAPKEEAKFPDITVQATASAATGTLKKVEFYDGKLLLDTQTAEPFSVTLANPSSAEHTFRAVATDNSGRTGTATCVVKCTNATRSSNFTQKLSLDDAVPQGWSLCNGSETRLGGLTPYLDGPRLLHFTNTARGFEYGMLVQNNTSRAKGAWAKYGMADAHSTLTLSAGHYNLKFRVCNWNQSEFKPVTICIEQRNGQEVASKTYTPTVNIGGDTGNKFGTVAQQSFEFDIPETGDYVIAFYTDATRNADFVLGVLTLQAVTFTTTDIKGIENSECGMENASSARIYSLDGQMQSQLQQGVNIIRTPDHKSHKVLKR